MEMEESEEAVCTKRSSSLNMQDFQSDVHQLSREEMDKTHLELKNLGTEY